VASVALRWGVLATSAKPPQQLLDEVHTAAGLARFSIDAFARAVADARADDPRDLEGLSATDAALRGHLPAIDAFTARVMKIALDVALADDTALAPAFHTNLAATILRYHDDRDLLRERVAAAAGRAGPTVAAAVADHAVEAAAGAFALRAALYDAVVAVARVWAAAALPVAIAGARDRRGDDSSRARWSVVEQELTALATEPARLVAAPWASRLASFTPVDHQVIEPEPSFGSLIELD